MKYGMGELYAEAKIPNPRLTFVVVQKRNHLRTQVLQDNESLNPPPGTSITTTVTDKDTNNFYLYSHYALQVTQKFPIKLLTKKTKGNSKTNTLSSIRRWMWIWKEFS